MTLPKDPKHRVMGRSACKPRLCMVSKQTYELLLLLANQLTPVVSRLAKEIEALLKDDVVKMTFVEVSQ
jgi:hypothetical protein